jgi:hypothetical protein
MHDLVQQGGPAAHGLLELFLEKRHFPADRLLYGVEVAHRVKV